MKRLWIAALLVAALLILVLALPAWAANGTWNNATEDDDWANAGNWDGGVPGAGDTATFDGSEAALGLPTANLPDLTTVALALTFFTVDYSAHGISEFSSGASCSAANINVWGAAGSVVADVDFGTAVLYGGCTFIIAAGATVAGDIELTDASIIQAGGAGAIFDGMITCMPSGGGTINWTNLAVVGGIDANLPVLGYSITHQNTAGATLTCDQVETLNLGTTDANSLAVTTTAAVTIGGDFACGTFSMGANVTCASARAATVGAGGFEMTAGTLTGTLTVDLSAAAGAYTQTDGTIAAAAVLNVTTGTGGFTWTALTQTGTVNITTAGVTALADWGGAAATSIDTLTINAATTVSGDIYAKKVVGNALLTIGAAGQDLTMYPAAANFLSGTFAASDAAAAIKIWDANNSNSGAITMTGAGYIVVFGNNTTWTQTGAVSVSDFRLDGRSGKYQALVMNAPLTVTGTLNFGFSADDDRDGKLTLGSGFVHRLGTVLRHANNTSTGHTFTIGGQVRFGGNVTLAGITTAFGDAKIDATAAITFDGATATGTTSGNCIITGRGGLVTFANMETNFTGRPLLARRFITDAGSVTAVQPAAPHWLTGMR